MAEVEEQLLDSCERLVAIQQKQLQIAQLERYDTQIDDIYQLEVVKLEHQNNIDSIRAATADFTLLSSYAEAKLLDNIKELSSLNDQLQFIISQWYDENSRSMRQVSVQRKTLQSYGGMYSNDVISYYIDSKN